MLIEFDATLKTGTVSKALYYIDGMRCIVKGNSLRNNFMGGYEPYSEALASAIAQSLGLRHISYQLLPKRYFPLVRVHFLDHVSVCPFSPLLSRAISLKNYLIKEGVIVGKAAKSKTVVYDMQTIFQALTQRGIDISFLCLILIYDSLIGNEDRHLNNIFLNEDANGMLVFSPLFDNGASLLAWRMNSQIRSRLFDLDIARPFAKTHKEQVTILQKLVPQGYLKNLAPAPNVDHLKASVMNAIMPLKQDVPKFRYEAVSAYLEYRLQYLEIFY